MAVRVPMLLNLEGNGLKAGQPDCRSLHAVWIGHPYFDSSSTLGWNNQLPQVWNPAEITS